MRVALHASALITVFAAVLASTTLFGAEWAVNATTPSFFTGSFSVEDVGKVSFTANAEPGLLVTLTTNRVVLYGECQNTVPGSGTVQQPVEILAGTGSKGSDEVGSWKLSSKADPDKTGLFLVTFSTFVSALDAALPARVFGGFVMFDTCKVSGKTKFAKDRVHLSGKFKASVTGMIQEGPNVLKIVKGKGTFAFANAGFVTD